MPIESLTAFATVALSPVSMTMFFNPIFLNSVMASAVPGRTSSAMAISPVTAESRLTMMTVLP